VYSERTSSPLSVRNGSERPSVESWRSTQSASGGATAESSAVGVRSCASGVGDAIAGVSQQRRLAAHEGGAARACEVDLGIYSFAEVGASMGAPQLVCDLLEEIRTGGRGRASCVRRR
jgi:hypothetical protein